MRGPLTPEQVVASSLLAGAARRLPEVACGVVLSCDIHTAFVDEATALGTARVRALQLADVAVDLFTSYLAGQLGEDGLRGWTQWHRLGQVTRAMRAAHAVYLRVPGPVLGGLGMDDVLARAA